MSDLLNTQMNLGQSLIWILLASVLAVYIIFNNKKKTAISREMIKMTEDSEKKCNRLVDEIRNSTDEDKRYELLNELENEANTFLGYKADQERWPEQNSRIMRHVSSVRTYITAAREIINKSVDDDSEEENNN